MCDIAFVNNPANIAKNPKVTAINSCIEVDLTGQVVSDSVGTRFFSGNCKQIPEAVVKKVPPAERLAYRVSFASAFPRMCRYDTFCFNLCTHREGNSIWDLHF